jgi:asparagine synthase
VAAHRISDVKVGSFLSGGVDSSYITACLMPDETFSVGFASPDGTHKFDETTEAGELSQKLGIKNYREMLTKEQCLDAFADIQYHMDEPQSNPSSVPLYFLCQLARQHVTVVLSGEGADEIYAGYEWYADTPLMQKYKRLPAPLRHLASDVSQQLPYFKGHDFIIKGSGRPEDWFIGQAHVFEEKDAYDILKPKYRVGPTAREVAAPIYDRVKDLSELEKKQYLDLNLWLPGDILLKADKMSMAHSLELRVPYLDREVLREAECYPDSYKLRGDTKAVLRTAANKTLPDAWANRTKKGFPVPIAKWLEDPEFSAKVRKSFTSDVAAEYFDQDKLVAMLADPKHERRKIWTAYTFLTWHEQFFEKFDA